MSFFSSKQTIAMLSAKCPPRKHTQLTDNSAGEFSLSVAARVGGKRLASHDFFLPPLSLSSPKTTLRKRRRIDCSPAQASDGFFDYPYVKTSSHPDNEVRRVLVYQVTPRLQPLWEHHSVNEFAECYLDIVETHFRAYEHGILHRDISDETAVVHKFDAMAVGCLVDWDISCPFDSTTDGEPSAPNPNRRGTTPFVAIDLQCATMDGRPLPLHSRYCHDLESLFWLLLWAVIHFDIHKNGHLPCRIPKWGHGTWSDVANFKHCILTAPNTRQGVLDLALPIYEDLVERWAIPLARMFRKARDDAEDIDDRKRCFFNITLYAEEATFDRFMATIQRSSGCECIRRRGSSSFLRLSH